MVLTRQAENLYREEDSLSGEIIEQVFNLINAEWDSPTLKKNISELMEHYLIIDEEIETLHDTDMVNVQPPQIVKGELCDDWIQEFWNSV